jgi:hypothetical protein
VELFGTRVRGRATEGGALTAPCSPPPLLLRATAPPSGGFAFGGLVEPGPDASTLDLVLYVVSCFAVHACTCSALTSAILFRVLHSLHDDEVDRWASANKWLLRMPMLKFGR